jgi:hypothetical protein
MLSHVDKIIAKEVVEPTGKRFDACVKRSDKLVRLCIYRLVHAPYVLDRALEIAVRNVHLSTLQARSAGARRALIARMGVTVTERRRESLLIVPMQTVRAQWCDDEQAECYVQSWELSQAWFPAFANYEAAVQRMALVTLYGIVMNMKPAEHWSAYMRNEGRRLRQEFTKDHYVYNSWGQRKSKLIYWQGFDGNWYEALDEPAMREAWKVKGFGT